MVLKGTREPGVRIDQAVIEFKRPHCQPLSSLFGNSHSLAMRYRCPIFKELAMFLAFICIISTLPPPIFLSLFTGAIGALSYVGTARHESLESLGVFQKKSVVDHASVVLFQRL